MIRASRKSFEQITISADEISEARKNLEENGRIVVCQHIAADCEFWQKTSARGRIALIDATHKEVSERAGTDLVELRAALRIQEPEMLESLVAHLCEGDSSGRIRHRTHFLSSNVAGPRSTMEKESAKRSPERRSIHPRARRSSRIRRLGRSCVF